jgi:hypothetical protein
VLLRARGLTFTRDHGGISIDPVPEQESLDLWRTGRMPPALDQCCAPDGAAEPENCSCQPGCDCGCVSCPCADDTDWFDVNPVRCRHCGAELAQAGAEWIDRETGFSACVKAPAASPGLSPMPADQSLYGQAVLHEPMPAGLDGAAE